MVRDLDWPLELVVVPTVREADGLALSSRNAYLDPGAQERAGPERARCARRTRRGASGERSADAIEARMRALPCEQHPGLAVEYVAIVEPEALAPVSVVSADTVVAVAGRIGRTRLIDNIVLGEGLV